MVLGVLPKVGGLSKRSEAERHDKSVGLESVSRVKILGSDTLGLLFIVKLCDLITVTKQLV